MEHEEAVEGVILFVVSVAYYIALEQYGDKEFSAIAIKRCFHGFYPPHDSPESNGRVTRG